MLFRQRDHISYITSLWYLKRHTHLIFIRLHKFFHSHVGPEDKEKPQKYLNIALLTIYRCHILRQYGKLYNISINLNIIYVYFSERFRDCSLLASQSGAQQTTLLDLYCSNIEMMC